MRATAPPWRLPPELHSEAGTVRENAAVPVVGSFGLGVADSGFRWFFRTESNDSVWVGGLVSFVDLQVRCGLER